MGKRIAIFAAVLVGLAIPAESAMTLVNRETFEGIGTYDTNTPGNLGTIFGGGYFLKRPVGPRTSSIAAPGWSGCVKSSFATYNSMSLVGTKAATNGVMGAWFYVGTKAISGQVLLLELYDSITTVASIDLVSNNTLNLTLYTSTNSMTGFMSIPIGQWFYLAMSFTRGSRYTVSGWYKTSGSAVTQIFTNLNGINNADFAAARFLRSNGGTSTLRGRMGMPSVYSISSVADVTYPTDLIDPVDERHSWYLNSATGDDNNTGLTVTNAWLSVAKINSEATELGLFPSTAGYTSGDTVYIDTSGASLLLGTNSLAPITRGLSIMPTPGQTAIDLRAWTNVTSWSKTSGSTNIYQSAVSDLDIVVWEDDKWLSHSTTGTGWTTAVANAIDTNPGRFFADGTNLYLHPFGSTDPSSDGKTYTRSQRRGSAGQSAVVASGLDQRYVGFRISKTCLCRKNDNDPIAAYGIQGDVSSGGTTSYEDCFVDYYSKHAFGQTDGLSNGNVTWLRCQGENGSPYTAAGGQTAFVSFNGTSTATNNAHYYIGCLATNVIGVIGSTNGAVSNSQGAFITHNVSGGPQFASILVTNCNWSGGTFQDSSPVASGGLLVVSSAVNSPTLTSGGRITSSSITKNPPQATGRGGTVDNCIITANGTIGTLNSGNLTIRNCTIDIRTAGNALFLRNATLTNTFENNVVIATASAAIIGNASTNDVLVFRNNVYDGTGNIAYLYNSGASTNSRTFAQWVSLGFDLTSVNQNACLGPNYRPYAKTPTWNVGLELGPSTDYTGKLFQSRRTAGAYEYAPPIPRGILKR